MGTLWMDFRHGARALFRAPYLTIISILSIGLGIGAATAVYSWLDGLVLHPFPAAADQGRLVGIEVGAPNGGMGAWSYQTYKELRDATTSFTGVAAFRILRVSTRHPGDEASLPLLATTASGNYFDVLGIRPVIGRAIDENDVETVAPVAVLGFQYWLDRFGGDRAVLGRTMYLNGEPVSIVGVAPPLFSGVYTGVVPHMYVPLTLQPRLAGVNQLDDRKLRTWLLFGRLRQGVTIEAAQADADAAARRIGVRYGDSPAPGAEVMPLRTQFLGKTLLPLFTAMLAVTILLAVVASANVASLMLVRTSARRHEIALRLALGASRFRVTRVVIVECALLAAGGSAIGVVAAYFGRGALYALIPRGAFPITIPIPMSWRVITAAAAAAAAVTMLCGIAPALAGTRVAPEGALRAGSRALVAGGSLARSAIVAGQLAFCVLFMVIAGMFVRGLQSASAIDVGFTDPAHVLLVDTDLRPMGVTDTTGVVALTDILARLRALPGVTSASAATMVPLGFGGRRIADLKVPGYAPALNEDMTVERAHVGADYAATMRITVVAGRDIKAEDRADARPVALVNETFVKRFIPGGSAIGRTLDVGRGVATIVGVLHDGKYGSLDEKPHPVVYVPLMQWFLPAMTLHVRTGGDPVALAEPVRRALRAVNANLPALQPRTLEEHIAASTFVPRTGALVLGVFALVALALSVVGLYGALAFGVALRAREFAIRLALGARRSNVAWVVAGHALAVAIAGLGAGAVFAFAGGRLLRAQVASVRAPDPVLATGVIFVLGAVVLLAAWIPARRAVALDPAVTLRGE